MRLEFGDHGYVRVASSVCERARTSAWVLDCQQQRQQSWQMTAAAVVKAEQEGRQVEVVEVGARTGTQSKGEMASWQMRGVNFPADPPTFV